MNPSDDLYDAEITVFSPDGRLFQVEYARNAVDKGSTILGLKYKDGVVLIATKFFTSPLVEIQNLEKIYQIDDYIGCAVSGLVADAESLIDIAREESQANRIWYDEEISVKALVEHICYYKHLYTKYTGVRPFGVALLIAGVDNGRCRLFATDPSGAFLEYSAVGVGKGSNKVMSIFEREFKSNLSINKAVNLGVKTLKKVLKKKIDANSLDIAIIDKDKKFRKISTSDIKKLI